MVKFNICSWSRKKTLKIGIKGNFLNLIRVLKKKPIICFRLKLSLWDQE